MQADFVFVTQRGSDPALSKLRVGICNLAFGQNRDTSRWR